jgi:hypothetical protein
MTTRHTSEARAEAVQVGQLQQLRAAEAAFRLFAAGASSMVNKSAAVLDLASHKYSVLAYGSAVVPGLACKSNCRCVWSPCPDDSDEPAVDSCAVSSLGAIMCCADSMEH